MIETKKIHRPNSTFSRLVPSVEPRTDQSLGGRGVYPRKNFINGFARIGETAQNKSKGGATCPSCSQRRRHGEAGRFPLGQPIGFLLAMLSIES